MRCRGPGALPMLGRRSTDHCNQAGASLPIRGRAPARSYGAGLPMFGRRSTDHRDEAGASLPIRGRAPACSCGAGLPMWCSLARIEGAAGPRQPRHHSKPWAAEGVRRQVSWWGFCSIRSLASACRRRVAPLMVQFPPFGDALDVGRARPCASHSAIPSVWWR